MDRTYRVQLRLALGSVLLLVGAAIVLAATWIAPDWFGSGGAMTKIGRTAAPVLVPLALFYAAKNSRTLFQTYRVGPSGFTNPFERNQDLRFLPWWSIANVRRELDGVTVTIVTTSGEESTFRTDALQHPTRMIDDLEATWRAHDDPGDAGSG